MFKLIAKYFWRNFVETIIIMILLFYVLSLSKKLHDLEGYRDEVEKKLIELEIKKRRDELRKNKALIKNIIKEKDERVEIDSGIGVDSIYRLLTMPRNELRKIDEAGGFKVGRGKD